MEVILIELQMFEEESGDEQWVGKESWGSEVQVFSSPRPRDLLCIAFESPAHP